MPGSRRSSVQLTKAAVLVLVLVLGCNLGGFGGGCSLPSAPIKKFLGRTAL
jgi:hypothetical protein